MKKLFFVTIFALTFSMNLISYGTEITPNYLFAKEINLDEFQQKRLEKDKPISDAILDGKNNLWMAGKTSVWMWETSTKRLKKIKLLSRKSDKLQSLKFSNKSLYITSNEHIFRMQFNPLKVKLFRHPEFSGGKSDRLQVLSDRILWLHTDGLVQFEQTASKPTIFREKTTLPKKSKNWFDEKNQTLWTANRAQIVTTDFRHSPPKRKTIHRAKHAFIDINGTSQGVLTYTNFSVLKFNTAAQLNQIIPTETGRTLLVAALDEKNHVYFFSDKLLEIFNFDKKTQQQTFLRLKGSQAIQKIDLARNHLIVLSNQLPKLFRLEANYNLSRRNISESTTL